ncbi:alpha/beta hydrolase [Vicingaceae bacterium]|nr:alpha/beta hydrolase [Vicingaceae bacterium]
MLISRNHIIQGKHNKPIVLDFGFKVDGTKKPIVVFAHGFKGFKDWGHFNKMMEFFIENDFAFVKFNFSHNGGTVDEPIDFPDLEAFGNNNYTKELDDLRVVIDWIEELDSLEMDKTQIYLIGHSRGGGISILASHEDKRIKKLITWAAVSDLINRYPEEVLTNWEKEGVLYIENSRTNQKMPLYYQLAEDTLNNKERFDLKRVANQIDIPHLIIHGTIDEVVLMEEAKNLKKWSSGSKLSMVEGADHVFGACHPFVDEGLPQGVKSVLEETLEFIK